MKETQTPRSKDIFNRRPKESPSSKSFSEQSKKHQKVAKKSLNADFASVSEDFLTESASESLNLSAISEVFSDNNHIGESESFDSSSGAENQSIITSEEVFTPISKNKTVCDESVNLSLDHIKGLGSNSSVDVEVVVNLLKQSRNQIFSSSEVSATSKQLLDVLVEAAVGDVCALPDREDVIDSVLTKRVVVFAVCFVVWLFSVTITILLRCSGTPSSSSINPSPT